MNTLNPSLTRGELWLLNTVVDFSLPICCLKSENLEALLNKAHYGLPLEVIAKDLLNLYHQGLIEVEKSYDDENKESELIELTADKLADILTNETRTLPVHFNYHYYYLTEKGGAYWEAFTQADWYWYLLDEYWQIDCDNEDSPWQVEVYSQNFELLQEFFYGFSEGVIDKSTVEFSQVDSFAMTYWKKLPNVHKLSFQYDEFTNEDLDLKPLHKSWDRSYCDRRWCEWR